MGVSSNRGSILFVGGSRCKNIDMDDWVRITTRRGRTGLDGIFAVGEFSVLGVSSLTGLEGWVWSLFDWKLGLILLLLGCESTYGFLFTVGFVCYAESFEREKREFSLIKKRL